MCDWDEQEYAEYLLWKAAEEAGTFTARAPALGHRFRTLDAVSVPPAEQVPA